MRAHPYREVEPTPPAVYPLARSSFASVLRIGAGFLFSAEVFVLFVAASVGRAAWTPAVLSALVLATTLAAVATFARLWPNRTSVRVCHDRIEIRARPYAEWEISRAEIQSARVVDVSRIPLRGVGSTLEGHLVGRALLPDGRQAIVLVAGARALELDLGDACALLAPERFSEFVHDVTRRLVPVDGVG